MRYGLTFILLASILVIISPAMKQPESAPALRSPAESSTIGRTTSNSACLPDSDVSAALQKLSFAQTYEEQQEALALLRDNAKVSIYLTQVISRQEGNTSVIWDDGL